MQAEDVVALMIPLTWVTMMLIESRGTGRSWPVLPWWRLKATGFFLMVMTLNAVLPSLWPPSWAQHSLFHASRLGVVVSAILGFALLTLATALMHRAYHRVDVLWRWVHQLHHAPQRLDVAGSVVFTPQEVVLNVLVFQLVVVGLLGLDPLAAAIVGYASVFYGMFQHFNIDTPTWLGWFIQRPEAHAVHHRRGHHAYNYADLPLWDMLWGTWRNPQRYLGDVGFEGRSSPRLAPLFIGRDANASLYGPANRGREDAGSNPA